MSLSTSLALCDSCTNTSGSFLPTALLLCITVQWCLVHLQDGSVHRFLHIAQDNFYRNLTSEEQANIEGFNFDHPAVSSLLALLMCCCAQSISSNIKPDISQVVLTLYLMASAVP